MYRDEIFENAKRERREESYKNLKTEISSMEFLNNVLECTTSLSERDFHVTTL